MTYLLFFFMVCLILGMVGVASNPAPYFGVVGLVVGVCGGCGVLLSLGASFVGLVLFLIYLGGMLVVFAYSVALAAEPYPEAWGGGGSVGYALVYLLLVGFIGGVVVKVLELWGCNGGGGFVENLRGDFDGVVMLYYDVAGVLLLCVWGLLLTLFVVFELARGFVCGGLRLPK
uniref:NADH-ubiquinone oxidoreductase chain 6 n=1 Tax=Hemidactylus bowringii TaxID=146913 RepID=A0A0A7E7A4_9SAUR|nr:NADH dehydrogenase subunit 6 [Hemidactylus bowringii]AIY61209.1 NADH dehydrogenase subunit 6 [Hemidactylus bowringii]